MKSAPKYVATIKQHISHFPVETPGIGNVLEFLYLGSRLHFKINCQTKT